MLSIEIKNTTDNLLELYYWQLEISLKWQTMFRVKTKLDWKVKKWWIWIICWTNRWNVMQRFAEIIARKI